MSDIAAIRKEFAGRVVFRPSVSKLASCLRFMMAASNPARGAADHDLGLALLLAEQRHLSDFGRPVTGCVYVMKNGMPAPSTIDEATVRVTEEEVPGVPDTLEGASVDLEIVFSNLSRSDMEYMRVGLDLVTADKSAALSRAESFMIDGRSDYALMVEDEDPETLRYKLEDLADWGRYFHLGR